MYRAQVVVATTMISDMLHLLQLNGTELLWMSAFLPSA